MAAYANAIVIRDALIKFASTEYPNQVRKLRLVPNTPIQTYKTAVPDGVVVDVDNPSWTLELEGLQDWETGGLGAYFNTNAGSLVTAIIAPVKGTGKKQATVSVRIVNVPFGGEVGEFATFDVEFGVQGQPTFAAQS